MIPAASTIFALSSGHGRAGVAIIRISGPAAGAALDTIAGLPRPKPRYAALRKLRHPETRAVLDQALVLFFAGPKSETGEDIAELHVHGGRAVIASVLAALNTVPHCRPAEPGEFARRAFENGKLDLTALEGLADLVDAETEAQRAQAVLQAGGALARLYDGWRSDMLHALALMEAGIDFSDEGDVGARTMTEARAVVALLEAALSGHVAGANRGEIVRDGFRVVLAGAPNAGKSSLLNALATRDVAIVSPEPGTTRDVIEVRLDLGGHAVVVSDTAGIRETASPIEQEGIRRTGERIRSADLVLWLSETETDPSEPGSDGGAECWVVRTKIDLAAEQTKHPGARHAVSVVTGQGLDSLTRAIAEAARSASSSGRHDGQPVPTTMRHRRHLELAIGHLRQVLTGPTAEPELLAEELRLAAAHLGRLTGRIDSEDVLGAIFGRFCIGK